MARAWRPFQAAYDKEVYTRSGIQSLSDKQLEKEYSRVRREATERLRSFRRSRDPVIRDSQILAEKDGLYLTKAQIKAAGEGRGLMEDLLLDAMKFLQSKRSTVSGQHAINRKIVNSLNAHYGTDEDPEPFTEKDLKDFGKFMDYARDRKDSKTYGSETPREAWQKAQKQGLSLKELKRHYKFYMEQIQDGKDELVKWSREEAEKQKKAQKQQSRKKKSFKTRRARG